MANDRNYWASPHNNGWSVKKEGAGRASSVHETQSAAWTETKRLARGSSGEAILQGSDGSIRTKNTYGKGPHPPKG